ncbi:L-serine dehydratase, beta subunit [Lachnospiraceae bacterium TWA4]|nr:L-serine dehydratase, beta subunit [Lachnospiraceae bacterium TWA4]
MSFISVFDVLGPNMIGPSSSHTAGAVIIGYLAKNIFSEDIAQVEFVLYGSFAKTYKGHGTDRALLGGLMGFHTDDMRIRDSFQIAKERGIDFKFIPNEIETDIYPNTVDIHMTDLIGQEMTVRGESIGGGKVKITRINGAVVEFTGEYSALIVTQLDRPGVVAHITKCMSDFGVNLAFMRLFRESKGNLAYTIVETDDQIPEECRELIFENPNVKNVIIVQK